MSHSSKILSYRSARNSFFTDSTRSSLPDDQYDSAFEDQEDVFDIPPKNRNPVSLQRWKKATLVLNAARRFRYTADPERIARLQRLRTGTNVLKAIKRFQSVLDIPSKQLTVTSELLAELSYTKNPELLDDLGGADGLANYLNASLEAGISDHSEEIDKRREVYGSNTYPRQPPKGFFNFVFDACKDPTLVILMVCALLSLIFGIKSHGFKEGWYDGASIAFAVILVILVTSISDYKQALLFMNLNEEKRNISVHVIRSGRRMQVSIFDVVVGDIVYLNIGDQVPADGIFVDGHALCLDESSMTGEAEPVYVTRKMPYLLSGCKVLDGYGRMLVTGVGMKTEWGLLMSELVEDAGEETPLQVRLNGVATFVGQIGLAVAVLVFVILIIFYFSGHKNGSNYSGRFRFRHTPASAAVNSVVDIFAIAVTIVVVAVPEGLPLAVTLSLAYAMKKMMVDRALVRRLSACETMGSATCVCTDKTGTLTLNQMTVVKAWAAGSFKDPVKEVQNLSKEFHSLLMEGIAQNTNASIFVSEEGKEPEVMGSPTEKAVLLWGFQMGLDFDALKAESTVLHVETFNSIKKRAGVAIKRIRSEKVFVHWKGAAEIVLEECRYVVGLDGLLVDLVEDVQTKNDLVKVIEAMAAESLRCIAFGYREMDINEVPQREQLEVWKIPEGDLTLIAVVGIKDPCRPGVFEAVKRCQRAGVKVRMVTGDNITTAKAIAAECGIFQGGIAIEGPAFRSLTNEMRKKELHNIDIMARSSPSDKLLMVRTLRELGEVVAVTGDGTNDAPALRDADIGLAMGIQGTEVAKESSDIIILDDDFASVVRVVRWGRSIYLNIQKFIQFQLTVNVAALTINFVAAVSSGDVPLTAVQLLWVNLIMDTLGALALATEPPTDELLQRLPVGRKEPLISNVMVRNLLLEAIYQIIILLTLQFRGEQLLRLKGPDAREVNNTVIFNAFVLCQVFNEMNARKPDEWNIFKGLFNNYLFVGIIGGTIVLQVIIVEFLNKFASTVKLSWQLWLTCIIIGFMSWPIAFVGKFIPVPEKPLFNAKWRPCWSKRPKSSAREAGTFSAREASTFSAREAMAVNEMNADIEREIEFRGSDD